MKLATAPVCRGRPFRAVLQAFFGAAIFGMAACSMPGPPPAEYVLGAMPTVTGTTVPQTGAPVVEVKRVQLPDYLDTTDILARRGNQLVPSSTGRWGERLSVGMTRALTASLGARLPRMMVTATRPLGRPAKQILVDVVAFEPTEGRQVELVASWTILDGASGQVLVVEQASLVEAISGTGDGAIVSAMSHTLEDLADQIASSIESNGGFNRSMQLPTFPPVFRQGS